MSCCIPGNCDVCLMLAHGLVCEAGLTITLNQHRVSVILEVTGKSADTRPGSVHERHTVTTVGLLLCKDKQ